MRYRITAPRELRHAVALPSSKSISNRALIIHALSGADCTLLKGVSDCDDTFVMQRALNVLEASVPNTYLAAEPRETVKEEDIDIGAAGTSMRFLTALLAVTPGSHVITGSERMRHRPIGVLVDALRQLGADIDYVGEAGFPPLRITGRNLTGGQLDIQGDVSSQYISALLMTGPLMANGLELHLKGHVISRPYIHMTMEMMRQYGADVQWHGNRTVCVAPQPYTSTPYFIEGDWSAASYWFEMMALGHRTDDSVALHQLFPHSLQGDAEGRKVFSQLGVHSWFPRQKADEHTLLLRRTQAKCRRLDYDFSRIPDLAQTVVVTCCLLGIPFRFTGLQTLRIKETDRIAALCTELRKLGVRLEVGTDDTLSWDGPKRQEGGKADYLKPQADTAIDTYNDHRMAMAFAPVALRLGSIVINHPEVVSKSYPAFWDDLRRAGFKTEVLE